MHTRLQAVYSLLVKVIIVTVTRLQNKMKRTIENHEYSRINLFIVSCDGERVGTQKEEVFSPNRRTEK